MLGSGDPQSLWCAGDPSPDVVCGFLSSCGELHFFMEKAMAPHSSTLACKISWTEEPGRLQSTGSLRVGHD